MTKYVDSFDTLDMNKWFVTIGRGYMNRYYAEKSKLHFISCYGRFVDDGAVCFRTASPYSILNNKFSVEVELNPYSRGRVYLAYAPSAGKVGVLPLILSDWEGVTIEKTESGDYALMFYVRGGGIMFWYRRPLEQPKTKYKLSFENKGGKSRFYVDDVLVSEYSTDVKVAYIYLTVTPSIEHGANRWMVGSFDNFEIENYELALTAPELASMMPTLVSVSQATLSLIVPLTIIGLIRGLVGG